MGKKGKTPDMNLPIWFDGQNINEALFCEEFLHERRILFANGAFFTPDGRVTDDLPLRGEIYDKLKFCAVNNIPRKITNILEVLKLEAQVPDFPPEQNRIHVSNGTLLLNGTFAEGRSAIVRSSLPVAYNPNAPAPIIWLNFLDGLLHAEDIPTLQEFIGYCLIPSNKGQRMMDTLDINDAHYDRKILDLQRRYDEQYDMIGEIEAQIDELQNQIRSIRQEKISGDNIYQLLLAFDEVYNSATEAEQKEFMKDFIERIDMFPEKRKDGCWIKNIVFNFPVPIDGEEVKELPLEYETTVETVALLSHKK